MCGLFPKETHNSGSSASNSEDGRACPWVMREIALFYPFNFILCIYTETNLKLYKKAIKLLVGHVLQKLEYIYFQKESKSIT